MNSQRKQQGKAGIKTDRYGIPLNYGNYKNGRLVNSKGKKGGKGGGKKGGGGGGGGGGELGALDELEGGVGLRKGEQTFALACRDLVRSQPPARQEQLVQARIAQQRLPHLQ